MLPKPYPKIEIVEGKSKFSIVKWGQGKRQFKLQAETETVLNLRTFYYPGWDIRISPDPKPKNRKTLLSQSRDGRIQLKLPIGVYNVEIRYKGTVAERVGKIASITVVLVLFLLLLRSNFRLWS